MNKDPRQRPLWIGGALLCLYVILISGCGAFDKFDYSGGSNAPPAPLNVTAAPVAGTPGAIQVKWLTQPTANIDYTVYDSTSPNVSSTRYDSKKTGVSFPPVTLTNLTTGATYYFVVTTVDIYSKLESLPSSPAASAIAP
ncbi:MAG: hypothetical protein ACYDBV_13755 [Nitrospiria bacterium]